MHAQRELEVVRAEGSEAVRKAESRAVMAERCAGAEAELHQAVKSRLAEVSNILSCLKEGAIAVAHHHCESAWWLEFLLSTNIIFEI